MLEEVLQQSVAMLAEDGLGVELHAFQRRRAASQFTVAHVP